MKYLFLAFALLMLSGCTSTMVEKVYEPKKGGVVRYMNAGADFVINQRIEDARKKMREFCYGPFRIIRESNVSQFAGFHTVQSGNASANTQFLGQTAMTNANYSGSSQSYAINQEHTYISFVCEDN